jgi:type IX secretion system PorP/SprF family membrane protein
MKTKSKVKWICIILLAYIDIQEVHAQDAHFSQFSSGATFYNPALTGQSGDLNAGLLYRRQWASLGADYSLAGTFIDSGLIKEEKSEKSKVGIGMLVLKENGGDPGISILRLGLRTAYHAKLNRQSNLSFGLNLGLLQSQLGDVEGKWASQFDGTAYDPNMLSGENFSKRNRSVFDASFGVSYEFRKGSDEIWTNEEKVFRLGFAVHHLNRPNDSWSETSRSHVPVRLIQTINYRVPIVNTNYAIDGGAFYSAQGKFKELTVGGFLHRVLKEKAEHSDLKVRSAFGIGVFHRMKDALILKIVGEYDRYKAGISYDFTTSKFRTMSGGRGAMEFFISCRIL